MSIFGKRTRIGDVCGAGALVAVMGGLFASISQLPNRPSKPAAVLLYEERAEQLRLLQNNRSFSPVQGESYAEGYIQLTRPLTDDIARLQATPDFIEYQERLNRYRQESVPAEARAAVYFAAGLSAGAMLAGFSILNNKYKQEFDG